MNDREQSLRRALGIPDSAQQVLILEQSAHCDWDWVAAFDTYYRDGGGGHQPVRTTLQQALTQIDGGSFTYAFCEAAYVQSFMNDSTVSAADKDALRAAAGSTFQFSSGGITSAENLTLHTEAFIRNYLLGRQWLTQTFGVSASNQMWIPDDFGHDAQLPVLLQAMGFLGAGFERIPAQAFAPNTPCAGVTASPDAPSRYLKESVGLDFRWQAADGSSIQGHWLSGNDTFSIGGYCAGNNAFGSSSAYGGGSIGDGTDGIETLIQLNTVNATPGVPYMFSPIDCDFTAPYTDLPAVIAAWNAAPAVPGVHVCLATFDQYMQLVASSMSLKTVTSISGANPAFVPHPYYSGCYGSKPLLKQLHYEAVRTLLFAESMQLILQANDNSTDLDALTEAWNDVMPSTHHDYITGTSPNGASECGSKQGTDVYREQVNLLNDAVSAAGKVKDDVFLQIAALQLPAPIDQRGFPVAVVVFNALAFERRAIAHLETLPADGPFRSSTEDFQTFHAIQEDGNGGLLFIATVPALGYRTVYLTTEQPTTFSQLSASSTGTNVAMHNDSISAIIDGTGMTTLTDPKNGRSPNYLGAPVNLVRYLDGGNIYRFGMEIVCPGAATFMLDTKNPMTGTVTLVESGPLRARAVVNAMIGTDPYTLTFDLYDTDTAVRVTIEGAAASGTSVMARVPFSGAATQLTYGTTSHWDTQAPRDAFVWNPPATTEVMTFEPTHEYVAPLDANGNLLGAIYHYSTPGWAIDSIGKPIGCLLRNTPGQQQAACGTDSDSHTVTFAVALPVGLQMPGHGAATSGSMLKAALNVNNPLQAVAVPTNSNPTLPRFMSLVSVSDDRALVTIAKAGTLDPSKLILRVYQPTDEPLTGITIDIDPAVAANYRGGGSSLIATSVTAIEEPSTLNLNLSTDASSVTLDLAYALTTVALG